jgi:hypothetical protein
MSLEPIQGPQTPPPSQLAKAFSFGLIEVPVIAVWAYIVLKLFVVDIDVVLMQALLPNYLWLLSYKFHFFLALFATWLIFGNRKSAFLMLVFFAFYPLLIIFWRIPKFILGRKSWVLAFAALNFVVGFVRSFRRNVVIAAILTISITVCLVATNSFLLYLAAITLCILILHLYIQALLSVFRSPDVYAVYNWLLPKIRNYVVSENRLDASLKAIPASSRNEVQQKEWANKLNMPLLTNRIYLFLARRFAEYQKSAAPYAASLMHIGFLFVVTTFAFASVNYAIYKADTTAFEVSSGSFFSFIWYSFNTILFNAVKEISPQSVVSQSLWMIEAAFALFLIAILFSLFFSIKSQRNASELERVISAMQSEGRELEIFIQAEYEIASIDEAIAELERLKTGLFQLLLWLTKNMR